MHNLARVYDLLGREQDALATFLQARNIEQKLVVAYPDMPQYQKDLANHLGNLGSQYWNRGPEPKRSKPSVSLAIAGGNWLPTIPLFRITSMDLQPSCKHWAYF